MNRTERLNDMIRYLNGRNFFQLKDLMDKYGITKSMASEDVYALAVMGMPTFKELGQGGKFLITDNKILPPIQLTMEDIYLLTFLLNMTSPIQPPTLLTETDELLEKLTQGVAPQQQIKLEYIKKLTTSSTFLTADNSLYITLILRYLLLQIIVKITYQNNPYTLQFFKITYKKQRWYISAYNFETEKLETFQCDQISEINLIYSPPYRRKSLEELSALEPLPKQTNLSEALTLLTAANITKSKQMLLRWIRQGKIKATLPSRKQGYLIDNNSLQQFIQNNFTSKDKSLNSDYQKGYQNGFNADKTQQINSAIKNRERTFIQQGFYEEIIQLTRKDLTKGKYHGESLETRLTNFKKVTFHIVGSWAKNVETSEIIDLHSLADSNKPLKFRLTNYFIENLS